VDVHRAGELRRHDARSRGRREGLVATDVASVAGNGNAYVRRGATLTNGTRQMSCWTVESCAAGANTVTFTMLANVTNIVVALSEYSGLGTFDIVSSVATANSAGLASTNPFTPAGAGETVIVHGGMALTTVLAAGASYVSRTIVNTGGGGTIIEDRLAAPAGAQTATLVYQTVACGCCLVLENYMIFAIVYRQPSAAPGQNAPFFDQT
jgi:hypothetical protein